MNDNFSVQSLDAQEHSPAGTRGPENEPQNENLPEEIQEGTLKRKRQYRQRAHCNVLSDGGNFDVPANPIEFEKQLQEMYPKDFLLSHQDKWLDIGCGYGGLLFSMAPRYPKVLMMGMEIRLKLTTFCVEELKARREQNPGFYANLNFIRTNTMKYLPYFFGKGQIDKMFFCYPDPHFKMKKYRQRIISPLLLDEYAFFLKPGGKLYTVTDVLGLHEWMVASLNQHVLFQRVLDGIEEQDEVAKLLRDKTDEAQKVVRKKGTKFSSIYVRLERPQ